MSYESYPVVVADDDHALFEFTSVGPRGQIKKIVAFTPTEDPNVFSLAFGDASPGRLQPDDQVVTDNGDRDKVLATVATIVDRYTQLHTDRWVYFRGSTKGRTRLYRIAINLNFAKLSAKYHILGAFYGQEPESFVKTKPYDLIIIKRKTLTL